MIFLDANTFYWYFGRDELGIPSKQQININKLRNFLDNKENKSLPSSVYMEIITHFRDDSEKLKAIISFISEKKIKIYNNSTNYCVYPDELDYVSIMSTGIIEKYAYMLKNKKVDIEVRFAVAFFEIVRLLYLEYIKKYDSNLNRDDKALLIYYSGKLLNKDNIKRYTEIFNDALLKGYEVNKEEQFLKDIYIDSLNYECININLFREIILNYKDETVSLVDALQDKYTELSTNSFDLNKDNQTMRSIVDELSKDLSYLTFAKEKICDIFLKKGFEQHQCEYIRDVMLTAWLERGQKIKKNDIFDMLCVGALNFINVNEKNVLIDATPYLISFDKVMKNYLETHSPSSYSMIQSFE